MDATDDSQWQIVPARHATVLGWSFGTVRSVSELYSPSVFGPEHDLSCHCGNYAGAEMVGRVCPSCGVIVAADASRLRMRRFGHVELSVPIPHPLIRSVALAVFPIAPIGLRVKSRNELTTIGSKYERLIEMNTAVRDSVCSSTAGDAPMREAAERGEETLSDIMADIIVGSPQRHGYTENEDDNLMQMLCGAIVGLRPEVDVLIRASGCALRCTSIV